MLSNLTSYDQVAESVSVEDLIESDARSVIGVLETLLENHPEEGLTIVGKEAKINKVIDVLIHRFVYVESLFGSEREFLDMMIKIVRGLMT